MKAVNLLPVEARPVTGMSLRGLGAGTIALLSGLAMAIVVVAMFVVLSNQVSSRQAERDRLQSQAAVSERLAQKLKPYADLLKLRDATLQQVRSLAAQRYDWPATLADIARALPGDVTLTQLDGEPAGSGSTAAPSTATPSTGAAGAAPAGPTVQLQGCTTSHAEAGVAMQRLRLVPGVVDVTLQSSTLPAANGGNGGASGSAAPTTNGCPRPEQFQMTIQLAASATSGAPAATGQATAPSASAPAPTPAPATTTATSTTPAPAPAPSPATPATATPPAATATPGGTK